MAWRANGALIVRVGYIVVSFPAIHATAQPAQIPRYSTIYASREFMSSRFGTLPSHIMVRQLPFVTPVRGRNVTSPIGNSTSRPGRNGGPQGAKPTERLFSRQALAGRPSHRAVSGGQLHVPDIVAILTDCPVRRKVANASGIKHTRPPPCVLIAPLRRDPSLRGRVGVEVGGNQKVVVMGQDSHQVVKPVRLRRRETAGGDCLQRAMQRRRIRDRFAR